MINSKKTYIFMVICSFFLISCSDSKDNSKDDKLISFHGSGSFMPDNRRNIKYYTEMDSSFGQYDNVGGDGSDSSNDGTYWAINFRKFKGLPEGEIYAYWTTFSRKDNDFEEISPKYYYAYSGKPVYKIPRKKPNHRRYIIHLSFGYIAIHGAGLTDEEKKSTKFKIVNGSKLYHVGKPDHFYYLIKSIEPGESLFKMFNTIPFHEYGDIQGIEITKKQYDFFRYNHLRDSNYLNDAPEPTKEQIEYMKRQGWKLSK